MNKDLNNKLIENELNKSEWEHNKYNLEKDKKILNLKIDELLMENLKITEENKNNKKEKIELYMTK